MADAGVGTLCGPVYGGLCRACRAQLGAAGLFESYSKCVPPLLYHMVCGWSISSMPVR